MDEEAENGKERKRRQKAERKKTCGGSCTKGEKATRKQRAYRSGKGEY